jgi:hypothetical protein
MHRLGTVLGILLLFGLLLFAVGPGRATPAHHKALNDYFGDLLPASVGDCATCHFDPKSGEAALNLDLPNPHNSFGARLAELGRDRPLVERLEQILEEDADGDGVSNVVELLAGTRPGLRAQVPGADSRARAEERLPALRARHSGYAWKPFEPVRLPPRPALEDRRWVRNPVDAYVAAERQARGLAPRPEAARHVLLRRIYLDLIGLPPTRAELHQFLADPDPRAYEKVVDRLLASPEYGERWGRHWMDVWRYSDWDGFQQEIRFSQPHIWRWRDWIVKSLNENRPYDRMVREMLAGDELVPGDPDAAAATGFVARNWNRYNRHEGITALVESTSKAFLGLTVNCARCHDHMYDPVSQKEYYAFRAFFEPYDVRLDRVPGELDVNKTAIARVFDATPDAETFLLERGEESRPDKSAPVPPGVPEALGRTTLAIRPLGIPFEAAVPDRREFVIREVVAASEEALEKARHEYTEAMGKVAVLPAADVEPGARANTRLPELKLLAAEARHEALLAVLAAEALEDRGQGPGHGDWEAAARLAQTAQRRQAVLDAEVAALTAGAAVTAKETALAAADADAARQKTEKELTEAREALTKAEKALSEARTAAQAPATPEYIKRDVKRHPRLSSGRRLALAQWITHRENPLAARVAVNHMWLRHFGAAIVPSTFDFGLNGQPPTHPALLDWLAWEFMRSGWDMKHLHRLMVTSSTYRMDSGYDLASAEKDPDNRYYWRMNLRRMESEVVRDSVLAAAGSLDRTPGGPDLDPASGLQTPRRSLYFRHSIEKQVDFLRIFDSANPAECYERAHSIMPQQALALANSELSVGQARKLAADLSERVREQPPHKATRNFIVAAFQQVLGRDPTREEREECERFLDDQAGRLARSETLTPFVGGRSPQQKPADDPLQRARESLVHVLFNHNDFVTIR